MARRWWWRASERADGNGGTTNHAHDVHTAIQARTIGSVHVHPAPVPAAVAAVTRVTPAEVEAAGVFVGRDDEVERVRTALAPGTDPGAAAVLAVAGIGGIGKTALARRLAADAARRDWFPGGVFWVDLHGYSGDARVPAAAVFAPLLRLLDVPGRDVPVPAGEQAALYHQVLARLGDEGRRVLLVLDNVAVHEQVRDLLPRWGPHRVVVTTRDTPDLPRAHHLSLGALDHDTALVLLDGVLRERRPGDDRVTARPREARALAESCAGLPLALRIAAALLTEDPDLAPDELARQLRRAPGVKGYSYGEQALAAVFDRSWQRLLGTHPERARLLRVLCSAPGEDLSTDAAAALAGLPPEEVLVELRGLRHAHLVEFAEGRWGLHDLVRAHTGTLSAPGLDAGDLDAAEVRLLDHYTAAVDDAVEQVGTAPREPAPTRFPDPRDALAWLEAERACLIAAVGHAATTGRHHHAFELGVPLGRFLDARHFIEDSVLVAGRVHAAAAHLTPHRQATAANNFGLALRKVRRFEESCAVLLRAGELFRKAGNRHGEAATLTNLSSALRREQRFDEAVTASRRAVKLFRKLRDPRGEAGAWNNLGLALRRVKRMDEAGIAHRRAGELFRAVGDRHGEAQAATNLGLVLEEVRRFDDAVSAHLAAGEGFRGLGDRYGEAQAWNNLGDVLERLGRFDDAAGAQQRARDLYRLAGDPHGEAGASDRLGVALARLGRFDDAAEAHHQAIELFRRTGDRHGEALSRSNLGDALRATGRWDEAVRCWERARDDLADLGDDRNAALLDRHLRDLEPDRG